MIQEAARLCESWPALGEFLNLRLGRRLLEHAQSIPAPARHRPNAFALKRIAVLWSIHSTTHLTKESDGDGREICSPPASAGDADGPALAVSEVADGASTHTRPTSGPGARTGQRKPENRHAMTTMTGRMTADDDADLTEGKRGGKVAPEAEAGAGARGQGDGLQICCNYRTGPNWPLCHEQTCCARWGHPSLASTSRLG